MIIIKKDLTNKKNYDTIIIEKEIDRR